ncbi:MAG: MBL fold metallo-hydrolase [Ruminiclostridium sp.]|nr:MBL fold metallo-hydrolase [Ruminiclostridium sp.]
MGIITAKDTVWIFDVGSNDKALELVSGIEGERRIVLSHFHADHTANLQRLSLGENDKIYGGSFTRKKFADKADIAVVDKDLYFDEGIHLFPIPSAHAKGCVGLETDGFAFVGDSTYCDVREGKAVYNAGQLQGLIKALKGLKAEKLLLSHEEPLECDRETEIARLEEIYALRNKNEPYIYLRQEMTK